MKVSALTPKGVAVGTRLLEGHEREGRRRKGLTGSAIKFVAVVGQMSTSRPLFTSPHLSPRHGEGTDMWKII